MFLRLVCFSVYVILIGSKFIIYFSVSVCWMIAVCYLFCPEPAPLLTLQYASSAWSTDIHTCTHSAVMITWTSSARHPATLKTRSWQPVSAGLSSTSGFMEPTWQLQAAQRPVKTNSSCQPATMQSSQHSYISDLPPSHQAPTFLPGLTNFLNEYLHRLQLRLDLTIPCLPSGCICKKPDMKLILINTHSNTVKVKWEISEPDNWFVFKAT